MIVRIPFVNFEPAHSAIRQELGEAFRQVSDSNWFILGSRLGQFEKDYAAFNQVKKAIGVSNGLDALFLSLKALDIGPGDEVIVPSNTYIATALAVSHTGATPVFVEPDVNTYNIDPGAIEAAITSRTKAIIPVHLYGQACEMDRIMDIANRHQLSVVEDNAQAHGAAFKSRLTGSWGHVNATSFYPGKNLGALGDAGAITTDNATLATKVGMLRNYGSSQKYVHELQGFNMRLDELQAAFLSVKLRHIADWTKQRQRIAACYYDLLKDIPELVLPMVHPSATHVYHLFVVRTDRRDELSKHLSDNGIGNLIHYPIPPHLQQAYVANSYKEGDFPIAEKLAKTCLSLPVWPGMQRGDVVFVADKIRQFFEPAYTRKTLPLVSIAAINYNNAKYVIETLDSIKAQTYPNIELVIVDDCSTDNSPQLIEQWLKTYDGTYKFIRHEKNSGVVAACNTGLRNATGRYFTQIATDDVMLPGKTELQVGIMESAGPMVAAVYSDGFTMDDDSKPLESMFIRQHLRLFPTPPSGDIYKALLQNGNYIPGMSMLFKRAVFGDVGYYDENLVYEDYDMWLRIARKYHILFSEVPSVKYRMRSNSLVSTIKNWIYSDAQIFLKHTDAPLPTRRIEDIADEAYRQNDIATLHVIFELGNKTRWRYLKSLQVMWAYEISYTDAAKLLPVIRQLTADDILSPEIANPENADIRLIFEDHALLKAVFELLPLHLQRQVALHAFNIGHGDIITLAYRHGLQTSDRYLRAVGLLWKYNVSGPAGRSMLDRIECYCNANVSKKYIDACIYKDIFGAMRSSNASYFKRRSL